jgi:Asp-tRNA(Asn)/Glu-tRNA(Gln) amidotransferase A subunit family amidase
MSYRRDEVKAPRLSGVPLRAFVSAIESPLGGPVLEKVLVDSGFGQFRHAPVDAPPTQAPLPKPEVASVEVVSSTSLAERAIAKSDTSLETVAAFAKAYREGRADPVAVAHSLNKAIDTLDDGHERMAWFISRKPGQVVKDAEHSAERLKAGKPLSVFDGVPVVLKDEVDLVGFPTTLGTKFLKTLATVDSAVAARLKAAGAIILGKANMNEIGINPIGLNPPHRASRNPWNRGRITGGSSSGSAAVVAAGLCPVSVGADGGGSIRIPAGLCGVVGLKATYGRIPESGVPPLCWNVGHVGPIGLTVDDVAAAYAVLAGPDAHDAMSLGQPPVHLTDYENGSLEGVRVGVCDAWFDDASAEVVAKCRAALASLIERGAKLVEIPAPDMNTVRWSHSVIIVSEMASAMKRFTDEDPTQFALDSRTNLAIGRHFRSTELVHAMRHRHQLTREWLALMKNVDVIVTPTTALTAPEIPERTLPDGESNLPVVDALMRFVRVGNLTGFPGLALPAGFDSQGLPISVQLMGRPYEEHLLLRLGKVIEAKVERRTPPIHVRALS